MSFTVDIHAKMRSLTKLFTRYAGGPTSSPPSDVPAMLGKLNFQLMLRSFLTGPGTVFGDVDTATFKQITSDPSAQKLMSTMDAPHLTRWFDYMKKHSGVKPQYPPKKEAPTAAVAAAKPSSGEVEASDDFKLVLDNAIQGAVVTRFPPEASGFLHIGHAKAAFINSMLRDKYEGKMVFRFDDTNPAKEKAVFEESIIEDLHWLGVRWDVGPTFTSDYFDQMMPLAKKLIEQGKAYADFTPVEEMRRIREELVATPCRAHSIAENLRLWGEMIKGSVEGQACCLRAKIDVTAVNGTMRDPTMYRVVLTPHTRTGTKYKAYPTYDFACPIVDALEGVTHALRTTEYHDRNEQFYWFIEALGLRRPILDDYSRLNMEYTVMSKRKLTQLVDQGAVTGWDDPRFPTVRAMARKGLDPIALRQFIEIQGMSKVVNMMEWSKLWNFNTKILDLTVARYTAVSKTSHVVCKVVGMEASAPTVGKRLRHKKNEALGEKPIHYGPELLLETPDVALLKEGEEVTLMDWGNAFISAIVPGVSCTATLNLAGDVKKTKFKLSWLARNAPSVEVKCVEFDNLLTVKKPDPEDPSFDKIVNKDSLFNQTLTGEAVMGELKKGDKLQIERRGYYIVDTVSPLTLFAIPDGGTKVNHLSAKGAWQAATAPKAAEAAAKPKEAEKTLEQKRAEKAASKAKPPK